jgi:diaminohydroxyphosphoribosylaminopyrimidine deaminase/5-amino-6-(5-phosphoribosylamino)uracil reductase
LYVTLEPCNHFGRTPPCTEKICAAGIQRVVVAMSDPNPDVTGGGNAFLRSQGITVECGVCVEEALQLNESFVTYVRTKRPFVMLKLAATLDGRIATRTGDARWVTGTEARAWVHQLRHRVDAILVGAGTVAADDPELTTRIDQGKGIDPIRIVLDTHLRLPLDKKLFNCSSTAPTYVACGPGVDPQVIRQREDKGVKVLQTALKQGHIDLGALVQALGQMQITSLLIEGGAQVAGSAVTDDIVDKILFFYAPKILGGDDGVPMLSGPGPDRMQAALAVERLSLQRVGEDILVNGYRRLLDPIDFIN